VDKWLKKVTCTLLTTSGAEGEEADSETAGAVRLHELESGELFAEAPLPPHLPVAACVEPAVDSSRYYVLRLVDATSGQYAFLGLGFATRDESSDFRGALAELSGGRERSREARRRRLAREAAPEEGAPPPPPARDFALAEGAKITLSVPVGLRKTAAPGGAAAKPRAALGGLSLAPPPPSPQRPAPLPAPPGAAAPAAAAAAPPLAPPPDFQAFSVDDDPFGSFQSASS